jgi:hypothetical protein
VLADRNVRCKSLALWDGPTSSTRWKSPYRRLATAIRNRASKPFLYWTEWCGAVEDVVSESSIDATLCNSEMVAGRRLLPAGKACGPALGIVSPSV